MFKRNICIIIVILLLTINITTSASIFEDRASLLDQPLYTNNSTTLYVGGYGPDNYTTIRNAYNDANEGDTIFVFDDSSPYFEHISVGKHINLIGENSQTTIIDGEKEDSVITVKYNAKDSIISGFTIQNSGYLYPDAGILLSHTRE